MIRTLKPKICKVCHREFTPFRSLAKACSVPCALEWARRCAAKRADREAKAERKTTREAKERLKTRSDHLRELQQAFNAWIRMRDSDKPCISCGRYHQGQYHAGHYMGVGRQPALRFEPDNVHKQCKPCNTDLRGNLIRYRARLVGLLGLARVEWLEGPHEPLKLTVDEIKERKSYYLAEVRRMKREA